MPLVQSANGNIRHIHRNGKGFRVHMKIHGKLFRGPTRALRCFAEDDLHFARLCGSRAQMGYFIELLHNGHARELVKGYQKIVRASNLQAPNHGVAKQSHSRSSKKAVKVPTRSRGVMRTIKRHPKIRRSKCGDASGLAGKSKVSRSKASTVNGTIAGGGDGKKLLLKLKKCNYEAIMAGRKIWDVRPLLGKSGRASMSWHLGTVGRVVILQSGRGTNNRARIVETRKYLGQANVPAINEMLLDLGTDLLPDAPSSFEARFDEYVSCYGKDHDLNTMSFVAMRLELERDITASAHAA